MVYFGFVATGSLILHTNVVRGLVWGRRIMGSISELVTDIIHSSQVYEGVLLESHKLDTCQWSESGFTFLDNCDYWGAHINRISHAQAADNISPCRSFCKASLL